jgi:hypothetical protein
LEKILIISYFYSPCNLTASQRVAGWAKHLNKYGFYPIIITRNWDIPITNPEVALESSGIDVKHEINSGHEVYYLPYTASKRDQIFVKYKNNSVLQKISKILTLRDQVLENFSNKYIPFANLYQFSNSYLEKHKDIKLLLISGNPFIQFKFGYQLHKKFSIQWIADYRDDWNTSELQSTFNPIQTLIRKLQSRMEKKWVNTASYITSVSPVYTNKISNFVRVKGETIFNGYEFPDTLPEQKIDSNTFTITYNGSLYNSQPIEIFLNAVKKIISKHETEILLKFPGLAYDSKQATRVKNCMIGYEKNIQITERVSKEEVLKTQINSDLLLMLAHQNIKGIPSSKLYEYIGLKKPILLYPNDHDIIEETLLDVGLGNICETERNIIDTLEKLINLKIKRQALSPNINLEKIKTYSRSQQTESLGKLLKSIT